MVAVNEIGQTGGHGEGGAGDDQRVLLAVDANVQQNLLRRTASLKKGNLISSSSTIELSTSPPVYRRGAVHRRVTDNGELLNLIEAFHNHSWL